MIDALLYAVRDTIRTSGLGFGPAECDIHADGHPDPRCGNYYVTVHEGPTNEDADNQLHEYYSFFVTLTMRVTTPLDRVGTAQIALSMARVPEAQKRGFYAKRDQLRAMLHMNWAMTVLTGQIPPSANDNIVAWTDTGQVYGFCEPARFRNPEVVKLVGGEWFAADPEADDIGLVSEMRFDGARRFQPQTTATGPFV